MGQAIATLVQESRRYEVVARFDRAHPLLEEHDPSAFNGADVAIDFSHPDVALDHIHRYCLWGQTAVIGTTGWHAEVEQVRAWVEEGQIGLLYAPNFSLGVALLARVLRAITPLVNTLEDWDAYVHELHHTGKADSPSGTAILLANELLAGLDRKTRIAPETQHGKIAPDALHVSSTRVGHVFGEHTVGFDSPHEVLRLTHQAKSRAVFAAGALRAAEWLSGKEGLFRLDDMLDDLGF